MTRRGIGVSRPPGVGKLWLARFPGTKTPIRFARSPLRGIPIPCRVSYKTRHADRDARCVLSPHGVPGQVTTVSSATKEASARRVPPPPPPLPPSKPPAEASRVESTCGAVRDIYDREHARASARLRTPCGFDNVMRTHVCPYTYIHMYTLVGAYVPVAAFPVQRDANGSVRGEVQMRSPARRRSRDALSLPGVDVARVRTDHSRTDDFDERTRFKYHGRPTSPGIGARACRRRRRRTCTRCTCRDTTASRRAVPRAHRAVPRCNDDRGERRRRHGGHPRGITVTHVSRAERPKLDPHLSSLTCWFLSVFSLNFAARSSPTAARTPRTSPRSRAGGGDFASLTTSLRPTAPTRGSRLPFDRELRRIGVAGSHLANCHAPEIGSDRGSGNRVRSPREPGR